DYYCCSYTASSTYIF
nr:immunoglobulin light chain junction region [Macaca mulatta]